MHSHLFICFVVCPLHAKCITHHNSQWHVLTGVGVCVCACVCVYVCVLWHMWSDPKADTVEYKIEGSGTHFRRCYTTTYGS